MAGGILEEIMAESPQTTATIFALKSCDKSYKNVMYFPDNVSIKDRLSKLSVAPAKSYSELQYIRENSYVELPIIYDSAHDYNYIVYNNGEGEGDVYAFVTSVEFLNFENTRFYIKKDVWTNYYRTANKTALIERTHYNGIPQISDIQIEPQNIKGMITVDSTSNYYFGIQIVYKGIESFEKNYRTARSFHFIFKYSYSDNSVVDYGSQGYSQQGGMETIDTLSQSGAMYGMCMYYIPNEFLSKFSHETIRLPIGASNPITIEAYVLNRNSPLDSQTSYTRTITLANPYTNDKDLLNRYPYAKRTIYCTGGTQEVNPLIFKGQISVKTSYYDGVDGMLFRHELSPLNSSSKIILYENAAPLPITIGSYAEYLQNNATAAIKTIASAVLTGYLGYKTMGLSAAASSAMAERSMASASLEDRNVARAVYARNLMGARTTFAGSTVSSVSSILNLIDVALAPDKIQTTDGGQEAMLYLLPNMFSYYDITLYDKQAQSCIDAWNAIGLPYNSNGTMNYSAGKYYTYIKTLLYNSNIYNAEDATEFESILMNGTTIWNMTSETDYKLYGHYVSYKENITS